MAARRIAVIGVHGVGDAVKDETARHVCALLQANGNYSAFEEHEVHIDVEPLPANGWAGTLYSKLRSGGELINEGNIDHAFMAGQLAAPAGPQFAPGANYRTIRLEGQRDGKDGKKDVHIYELFWSDLSSTGTGISRILGELFQLLFHLSRLGSHTATAGALCQRQADGKIPGAWRRYAAVQEWTSQVLSRLIPLLNLLVLVLALGLNGVALAAYLLASGSLGEQTLDATVLVLICAAGLAVYLNGRRRGRLTFVTFLLPLLLFVAVGSGLALAATQGWLGGHQRLLVDISLTVALTLGGYLISRRLVALFDRRFPGSQKWYHWLAPPGLLVCQAVGFWKLGTPDRYNAVLLYEFKSFEAGLALLAVAWLAFFVLLIVSALAGLVAVHGTKGADRAKAWRAAFTSRFTLALPAFLFISLGLTFWAVLCKVGNTLFGRNHAQFFSIALRRDTDLPGACDALLGYAASSMVPLLTVPFLLAVGITLWGLWPSISAELSPPKQGDSVSGGQWLTYGYRFMRIAGEMIYCGLLIFGSCQIFEYVRHEAPASSRYLLQIAGALVGTTGASVLVLGSRLKSLTGAVRPVLKASLDVDNWLREHPSGDNPTSKICARYSSLLRYLTTQDYSAVVIVAHSQGTAITADFLRYLKTSGCDLLDGKMPYLLTVGSPLRQLYSLRFPHLYGWARHETSYPDRPDPASLNVACWVNGYRSGDYIGRCLWHSEEHANSWHVGPLPSQVREDFCLGAGAHTHYLDHTAEQVGKILDAFIAAA